MSGLVAAKALWCVGPVGLEETLRPDRQTSLPLLIDVLTIAIARRECQTSQTKVEQEVTPWVGIVTACMFVVGQSAIGDRQLATSNPWFRLLPIAYCLLRSFASSILSTLWITCGLPGGMRTSPAKEKARAASSAGKIRTQTTANPGSSTAEPTV